MAYFDEYVIGYYNAKKLPQIPHFNNRMDGLYISQPCHKKNYYSNPNPNLREKEVKRITCFGK